jgi:hypothetical protein
MEKDESGALYYTIGWMSSRYFLSNDMEEKRYIVKLFKGIKQGYGITDINSLDSVIKDYQNGSDQI